MTGKKALRILFKSHWSTAGWKLAPDRTVSPEAYAYAVNAGVMFEPVYLSHDELVDWVHQSRDRLSLEEVVDAFLASLSTRRLELRSALGSYAIALNFPKHAYAGRYCYHVCGEYARHGRLLDLSELSFERHKWGGVRHLDPHCIGFDLERFSQSERLKPTSEDIHIIREIIHAATSLSPDARPRVLEKGLVGVLESNKSERETLIQIPGFCGILQPQGLPGFFHSFVKFSERKDRPDAWKINWQYPISWWQGKDGVNGEALRRCFPQLNGNAAYPAHGVP